MPQQQRQFHFHYFVDGNEEQSEGEPGQEGQPDFPMEQEERDADLERQRPTSVERVAEVDQTIHVRRHGIDDLTRRQRRRG